MLILSTELRFASAAQEFQAGSVNIHQPVVECGVPQATVFVHLFFSFISLYYVLMLPLRLVSLEF